MNSRVDQRLPPELRLDDSTLQALRQRDPLRTAIHTLITIGAYVVVGGLALRADRAWLYPASWLLQGFLLSCFFDAAHECIHGYFTHSGRANRVAGTVWLLPVLVNYALYRRYHLQHHRFTRVTGDPEPAGTFRTIWDYLACYPFAVLYSPLKLSFNAALGRLPTYLVADSARREIRLGTFALLAWLCVLLAATAYAFHLMVCFYWGPLLFVYPIAFTTVLLEHHGCDAGPSGLATTRSIHSTPLFRYLIWNGNYHAEHHAYPSVPAHNLPRLHKLLGHHFKHREPSYVGFHLRLFRSLLRGRPSTT